MTKKIKLAKSNTRPKVKDLDVLLEEYTSKLEQKIAEETRFFRIMADAMPQIVWTARADGTPEYFNRQWYEYTGLTEQESLTRDGRIRAGHPDDIPVAMEKWIEAVNTGSVYQVESRFKEHQSGEYRWFLSRALPGKDAHGNIIKWFGTSTDIDDHKKAQEKKDEFIAIASHELKTPLTSIKAFAQLLKRRLMKSGDSEAASQVTKMDYQIDKLTELVRDLLDISKIDSGKLQLRKQEFTIGPFVEEVVDNLSLISGKHRIEINGKANAKVVADKDRLEQVIANLISNAVKYSPHADSVKVLLKVEDKMAKIGVKDYGVGIPKKQQPHVFERFFRVSGSKRETFPGLGLGLYISAEIIRRQGGKIWVESQPGQGSTFYFTVPAMSNGDG